ncbi:MAG: alpha/beta hydrolase [Acidobacteriota bacterium]
MRTHRPRLLLSLIASGCLASVAAAGPERSTRSGAPSVQVGFDSGDGLLITADLYQAHADPATPFIVLFHQAGWSRGEYREIAPRLNQLGFNCLAVDQRSGSEVNEIANETAARAEADRLGTSFLDARQDLVATLSHVRENWATGPVIAWGSSYSAALLLRLAGMRPDLLDGVLAFAPGEYFIRLGKHDTWVRDGAARIRCPTFVTSARNEHERWREIFHAIPLGAGEKTAFIPESDGQHGSRALWQTFRDSGDYWAAVEDFLSRW